MFGSLIRRKPSRPLGVEDGAFDSTTFSLSTAVPRPTERRTDERVLPMLRIAKLKVGRSNVVPFPSPPSAQILPP